MLVRVSRNCPWNHCAFCPVYKGEKFSLRTADEVLADLAAMKRVYGDAPRTVFLQDANPILSEPDDLVTICRAIRELFPNVDRITAYGRSHTLAKRSLADLTRIRQAGLNRVHVGMESGCDEVLELVKKGSTRAQQIEGGKRAKQAGFELSEYIMPGLGGTRWSDKHAKDSASALCEIAPDFIRLRTTAVVPCTPLCDLEREKQFEALSEAQVVQEIRTFLAGLTGLTTRIESDHVLNLLMNLRGDLPADLPRLLALCDRFLELPERQRQRFILARRLNLITRVDELDAPGLLPKLDTLLDEIERENVAPETFFHELRKRTI